MKTLRYMFEAFVVYTLFFIFRLMPPDLASNTGGLIGRTIGPRLATSRKAIRNIALALPDTNVERRKEIVRNMWDNLGRIVAEYPHLSYLSTHRTTVQADDDVMNIVKEGNAAIFISGHIGNWEINCATQYTQFGVPIHLTYRAPNNPFVDRLLLNARTLGGKINAYPKSRASGRDIVRTLSDEEPVGILIDQKYNEGMAIPFFGHPAMTNPVFVQLAQKFNCPLVPVRCVRLPGKTAQFRTSVFSPIPVFDETGEKRPVEDVIRDVHTIMEAWIAETPGQWLWLHRRWDSAVLNE